MNDTTLLAILILVASVLYSAVGQAGGSGYLAVMAFLGIAPEVMRPTALVLNLVVASIAMIRFYRAGHLVWSMLWPFLIGSIPFAFIGGLLHLPRAAYNPILGVILLVAAVLTTVPIPAKPSSPKVALPVLPAVASGSVIGFVAGLTGTGGGVLLSPLLLMAGWADPHRMAGLSTAFILANSAAALFGNLTSVRFLPDALPIWAGAALLGGFIGSGLGSRTLPGPTLRRLLAVVLVLAAFKLLILP